MKKIIALVLCIAMCASLICMPASAASSTLTREEELAEDLKALGLFKGVSETDFALDRAPTRVEALVMLVRVLGRESDALAKGGRHPFLDVPQWADKYVGYAYENNLTNGISATKFGSSSEASASMYITFVLRALGYSDSNGDFTWDNPYALARQVGVMNGNPDITKFLRADVVLVSYAALEAEVKGTGKTLAEKLIEAKVFTVEQYEKNYNVSEFENEGKSTVLSSEEIYKKCSPAVFYIEVYDAYGKYAGNGSGFFINSDGTAVTNYHVIEGAYSAKIKRPDNGKIYKVEGVYDYSPAEDWAVIKIEGENFPYLEIERNEKVSSGQAVYAIGSPLGLENTISEGLVSNAERVIGKDKYIQISVPISPGSSGGALINKTGKVIGITSSGIEGGQNLNLARPISVIDGFEKKRPVAFAAIGGFEESQYSVGHINTSGMTEAEAATTLLRAYIENNANIDMSGASGYYTEKEDANGRSVFIITYDKEYGMFGVVNNYAFNDGGLLSSTLWFEPDGYQAQCYYEYYYDENSDKADASGEAKIYKEEFEEGMRITFDYDIGVYPDTSLHEGNASVLWLESVLFLHSILEEELGAYDIDGAAALGFENFYE